MFARFDENPAMTLQVIKKTKRYGRTNERTHRRTHARTHARTHGQRENSLPHHKQSLRGYKYPQKERRAHILSIAICCNAGVCCALGITTQMCSIGDIPGDVADHVRVSAQTLHNADLES